MDLDDAIEDLALAAANIWVPFRPRDVHYYPYGDPMWHCNWNDAVNIEWYDDDYEDDSDMPELEDAQ